MPPTTRRQLLQSAALAGGAALVSGCAGGSTTATGSGIDGERNSLSILEWGGYEARGSGYQMSGLAAGAGYTREFGKHSVHYTSIVNDDEGVSRATHEQFDIMHPHHQNIPDYVGRGLVQPWDASLLPSFANLDPVLVERCRFQGPLDSEPRQYMIPWDWGFGSLLYRTDRVDPARATGWELAWDGRYRGRISLNADAVANMELTALLLGYPHMDQMTAAEIAHAQAALLRQRPLTLFYSASQYDQTEPAFAAGRVWISYAGQDALIAMRRAGLRVAFMRPRQGRLMWLGGFMLGAHTRSPLHAHRYVESYINHASCVQMMNLFDYGTADATVTAAELHDPALAEVLEIGRPDRFQAPGAHLQGWQPDHTGYQLAWSTVYTA